jgi:hypothetical protein
MKAKVLLSLTVLAMALPLHARAQSDGSDVSLGDLARSLRKQKEAPKQTVIDNDNFIQLMDEIQSRKLAGGSPLFTFDPLGKDFQVSAPDVTCSLSFNADNTSLLANPYISQDLPDDELAKIDGPATIDGDRLQITIYNGTTWNLKEITVGLTVLRQPDRDTAYYGTAKLMPAAVGQVPMPDDSAHEKRPDLTVLYHLKGTAAPSATAVFTETLGAFLSPDQEWHWSIVSAKGVKPPPVLPDLPQMPGQE